MSCLFPFITNDALYQTKMTLSWQGHFNIFRHCRRELQIYVNFRWSITWRVRNGFWPVDVSVMVNDISQEWLTKRVNVVCYLSIFLYAHECNLIRIVKWTHKNGKWPGRICFLPDWWSSQGTESVTYSIADRMQPVISRISILWRGTLSLTDLTAHFRLKV